MKFSFLPPWPDKQVPIFFGIKECYFGVESVLIYSPVHKVLGLVHTGLHSSHCLLIFNFIEA